VCTLHCQFGKLSCSVQCTGAISQLLMYCEETCSFCTVCSTLLTEWFSGSHTRSGKCVRRYWNACREHSASKSLCNVVKLNMNLYMVRLYELGPVAPSRFNTELDQIGRRELVHSDCALHHIFSWTRSALNSSLNLNRQFRAIKCWTWLFTQVTKKQWPIVQILTC